MRLPTLVSERGRSTWKDYTDRNIEHADPTIMSKESWCLLYSKDDYNRANKCVDMMKDACGKFGIRVEDPEYIEVGSGDSR